MRALTYWQQEVDNVHDHQHYIPDLRPTVCIGDVHQEAGDAMMGKHLAEVFPPLFKVDSEELLKPEG